jgi:hypothetical protein
LNLRPSPCQGDVLTRLRRRFNGVLDDEPRFGRIVTAYQAFPAGLIERLIVTSNTAYTGSLKGSYFMKKKVQHSALAISLLALVLAAVSLPAYAQPQVNTRTDKSAYAPGDSGTLTISIINTIGSPLLIRNITIYYPWAGYDTNGKWFTANYSYTVSPPVSLATKGANNYSYTSQTFNIPSWWGINSRSQFPCPGSTINKFGTYSGCILLGTNETMRYEGFDFGITMALAVYNPSTLSAIQEWVPVATLIVLVIATAILAVVMLRLGNLSKKS